MLLGVCCVMCTVCCVLCTVCHVLCAMCHVSCAMCCVSCAMCCVLCAVCCVSCTVCRVSCATCCVSRLLEEEWGKAYPLPGSTNPSACLLVSLRKRAEREGVTHVAWWVLYVVCHVCSRRSGARHVHRVVSEHAVHRRCMATRRM
jgi:hypothetical protein